MIQMHTMIQKHTMIQNIMIQKQNHILHLTDIIIIILIKVEKDQNIEKLFNNQVILLFPVEGKVIEYIYKMLE